jgi:hypothetical protein
MRNLFCSIRPLAGTFVGSILLAAVCCSAGNYTNFNVAIYIPVGVVQRFENLENLTNDWNRINRQLKVDKVYIEAQPHPGNG